MSCATARERFWSRPPRPKCKEECTDEVIEKSADFRVWHVTDLPKYLGNVRYWVNSGKHVLALSFSGFDPISDIEHFAGIFAPFGLLGSPDTIHPCT